MIDMERIDGQHFVSIIDPGGGGWGLEINMERISS